MAYQPIVLWVKLTSSNCIAANLQFNCEALSLQAALIPYTTDANYVYTRETQTWLLIFLKSEGRGFKKQDKFLRQISNLQENL